MYFLFKSCEFTLQSSGWLQMLKKQLVFCCFSTLDFLVLYVQTDLSSIINFNDHLVEASKHWSCSIQKVGNVNRNKHLVDEFKVGMASIGTWGAVIARLHVFPVA